VGTRKGFLEDPWPISRPIVAHRMPQMEDSCCGAWPATAKAGTMEPDGEILILTVVRSRAASLVTIDAIEVAALEIDEAIRRSGRDEIGLVWTPRTPSIARWNEIAGPTDLTRRTNEPLGG
jgi:hypothetical protein